MKGYTISDGIKFLRENSKQRKFNQTYDLVITLRNMDLKKPENKISKDVILPHGKGKDISVCIISDSINDGLTKNEISDLDAKGAKEIADKYDFFICEPSLMVLVGKVLGRYLGPKGKMPRLLPPGKDPASLIEEAKASVKLRIRDAPVFQISVGTEKMTDEQIKENIEKVVDELRKALPPKSHIKNALLKLTMGKPVQLNVI